MTQEQAINWELCMERAAGREEVATEMLSAIIDELPLHKRELLQAIEQRDTNAIANSAHKLSGLCCYSGLPQLKDAAQILEEEITQDETTPIHPLFDNLILNIDRVLEHYQASYLKETA